MKKYLCLSPCFQFFGHIPRSIDESYGNSMFNFLFSTAPVPFYIATCKVQRFQLLHILTSTCYSPFRKWEPSWGVWSGIPLWFPCALPCWLRMLSIFSCTCWPFVCIPWRNVYSSSFKLGCLSFCCLIVSIPYILWTVDSYTIWLANIFSHSVGCPFFITFLDALKF